MTTEGERRIGILGGMGPLAGVRLQELIIENTPAEKDQDHIQVLCFTNPQIPDRTSCLKNGNTSEYVKEVVKGAKILEKQNVLAIGIPCNTAHSRIEDIQKSISVPILNMISLANKEILDKFGKGAKIGLLATDGTLDSKIYENFGGETFSWVTLGKTDQRNLMSIIYKVKAGSFNGVADELFFLSRKLLERGVSCVVLGCTELSLFKDELAQKGISIVDPLSCLAEGLVSLVNRK